MDFIIFLPPGYNEIKGKYKEEEKEEEEEEEEEVKLVHACLQKRIIQIGNEAASAREKPRIALPPTTMIRLSALHLR